jgi:hypothetical protein
MLGFETLTFAPIDRRLIEPSTTSARRARRPSSSGAVESSAVKLIGGPHSPGMAMPTEAPQRRASCFS